MSIELNSNHDYIVDIINEFLGLGPVEKEIKANLEIVVRILILKRRNF